MSLPNPILQDTLFFIGPWTRELEETVIRKMASEYWEGTWICGNNENNKQVMRIVQLDVKHDLGIDIPIDDSLTKLAQLEDQFHNFSKLIARDDVVYSEVYNTVETCADTWWEISETNPNLLVYLHHGKACWHYLKDLFVEVIEISDTSGKAQPYGGDNVQVRASSGSHSNISTGRRNQRRHEVIQILNSNSDDHMEFSCALYVSLDSTSNAHHQSNESRCESGVVDQSSYSLDSLGGGFSHPSTGSDSF